MMAAFNVTALPDLGYPETTKYIDPMEARWRAKPFTADEFSGRTGVFSDASIQEAVESSALANPYADVAGVENALDQYYAAINKRMKARESSDDNVPYAGAIPRYRRFSF